MKTVDFRTRYGRRLKAGWQSFSRQLHEELWFDDGRFLCEFRAFAGRHRRDLERTLLMGSAEVSAVAIMNGY
jgi:hypothetical protein